MRENFLTSDQSISGNFQQLWFLWQKSPPPPGWRKFFFTSDLSISGNFDQLWFWWQKIFSHRIYPFQAISSNFGFWGRIFFDLGSIHFPNPRMRENFLTSDLSISGNFEQLWFLWQKSPPPSLFCLFIRNRACITQVEYPRSPYYKSILRFLLSKYLL